jgi:hypothetical protein
MSIFPIPWRHVMCEFACDVCDDEQAGNEMHVFKDPFTELTELWACIPCVESLGKETLCEHVRNTKSNQINSKVLGLDLDLAVAVKRSSGVVEHDWMICGDAPVVLCPKQRQISLKIVNKTSTLQKQLLLRTLVVLNPRFERIELDFSSDAALRDEHRRRWRSQVVDSKFYTRKLMILLLRLPLELVREMLAFFIKT